MNIEKLELLVDSLKANHSGQMVDAMSFAEDPGCHAYELYLALQGLGEAPKKYYVKDTAEAVSEFLEVGYNSWSLPKWAEANPDIWGNESGPYMYGTGEAFDQCSNRFPSQVIVDKWDSVVTRLKEKA